MTREVLHASPADDPAPSPKRWLQIVTALQAALIACALVWWL